MTAAADTRPARSTTITAIDITVLAPPPDQMSRHALRRAARDATARRRDPRKPTRREQATALMTAEPDRSWTARELAEWARHGLITRTVTGRYTLNTPTAPPSSTQPDDQ